MTVSSIQITTPPTGSEAPAPTPDNSQRPAWLPEKFASPEDMAKAYTELSQKLGTGTTEQPAPPAPPAPTLEAAQKQATDAGFDLKALSKEWAENGEKLTETTLAALKAKGIAAETVTAFAQGAKAVAAAQVAELAKVAGGNENLTKTYEWAKANLTSAEIEAYNSVVESGNPMAAKMAFEGLFSRYTTATGTEPSLLGGGAAPNTAGPPPFLSNAQVSEAFRDPRYKSDAAFRAEVERRMTVTDMGSLPR